MSFSQILKDFYQTIFKSVFTRYLNVITNFIFLMVLSRTFSPYEFGIIAALNVFHILALTLSEGGLNPIVINIKKLKDSQRDGLFSFTFFLGALFAFLFFIFSDLIANFYNIERITEIIPFFTASILLVFLNSIPLSFLQREKKFIQISTSLFFAEIASSVAAVVLIGFIDPLLALASKITIHSLINFSLCIIFCSTTQFGIPKFGFDLSLLPKLFKDAKYQYSFSITNFFSRNIDNVLVGKFLGVSSLSVYDRAYLLMKYPIQLITFALTPAIQPVITKMENKNEILKIHNIFILRLSIIAAFAGLFCFLLSEQIVFIILGNQWGDVVPIFQLLSISLPLQIVYASHGGFFQAMNKFKLLFLLSLFSTVLFMLAFLYGVSQQSLEILCWGFNYAFLATFVTTYVCMYKYLFKRNHFQFFLRTSPSLLAFFIMAYLI